MRKVDPFTAEAELSLPGRIVGRTRRVLSQDGQTMTIELRRNAPCRSEQRDGISTTLNAGRTYVLR